MRRAGAILGLLLFLSGQALFAQTNGLEMPTLAQRLSITAFEVVNRIPASHLKQLPKALPVYRYSAKPREFSPAALQTLLDESAFAGTNATDLLRRYPNEPDRAIRLATPRNSDSFVMVPEHGTVVLQSQGIPSSQTPDSVPSFEAVREQLLRFARMFEIGTNQLARSPDGAIRTPRTEDKITRMGGAVRFIGRRSVRFSRSLSGYPILGNSDKIELVLGSGGRILKFELKWPLIESVETNRLFAAEQLIFEIARGNALADVSNEYPPDGVSKIVLNDIRVFYYVFSLRGFDPPPNATVFPVASLHVTFTSKSGKTEEGGMYAPIMESR